MLDNERMQRIRDAVAEIVDDLATHVDQKAPEQKPTTDEAKEPSPLAEMEKAEAGGEEKLLPDRWRTGKPVLCIPGPSLLDEAAATMVAHLVERQGIGARAEQADALSMSRMFSWEIKDVALICLCYIEHATSAQIRYAIRRIRRRSPDVLILVALFGNTERIEGEEEAGTEFIQQSLREAVGKIVAVASKDVEAQPRPQIPVAA